MTLFLHIRSTFYTMVDMVLKSFKKELDFAYKIKAACLEQYFHRDPYNTFNYTPYVFHLYNQQLNLTPWDNF